ncbi:growth-regulating factor 8-like [Impatiens glandulifera]|uniref:growth-regulating factor 8-like n=1 Tax=Impatiens glandulifera TaxID=253017 RepID=UPI001FB0DA7A|nr:growth-regulating factor 8-like [Impatiens glandulifera]
MQEPPAQHQGGLPLPPPAEKQQPAIFNSSSSNKDLEPGRCKRTDGKKWRCSKPAVAPNYKYCDSHLNRGGRTPRRRSRKLVELLLKDMGFMMTTTAGDDLSVSVVGSSSSSSLMIPNNYQSSTVSSLTLSMAMRTMSASADGSIQDDQMGLIKSSSLDMDHQLMQRDLILTNNDGGFLPTANLPVQNKRRRMVSSDRDDQLLLPQSMAMAAAAGGYILDINVEEEEEEDDDKPLMKSNWSSSVPDGGPLAEALGPCLPFWGSDPIE